MLVEDVHEIKSGRLDLCSFFLTTNNLCPLGCGGFLQLDFKGSGCEYEVKGC